jgi:spermidine synthase
MVASGFAGLGYQIVWTQECALWLGHESAAVLAVISAFFGGLALGGLVFGERIEKSRDPRRWYVACELVIALFSFALVELWSPFSAVLHVALGVEPSAVWQWSVAFFGTFLLLLPATAAMGATLPAMERLTLELERGGRSISSLYAANTLGAVCGVLAATFWLIPNVGLARTGTACAGLNLLCATLALAAFPRSDVRVRQSPKSDGLRARAALFRLALTGLLGIGYEVLVVRVLSQVTENTVYTFALLLVVYLVGTAGGAAAYRRWLEARGDPKQTGERLFAAQAVACLLGTASLWFAEDSKQGLLDALGAGVASALTAEAAIALLAFGLPTLVMGALFSHLGRMALSAGVSFGRASGVNVLAAAAAPPLCGVAAVPLLGAKFSLLLVSCGYLAAITPSSWRAPRAWLPAALAVAIAWAAPPLRFVQIPQGGHVVEYREGVMAAVSVVADAGGALRLRINNRQQEGSSVTRHVDARQAWLPLLLHPAPRRALFLGLGTGITASSASDDPALEVEAVELLPEVIAASRHFVPGELNATSDRLRIVAADARRFVRVSDQRYDVIIADNFHPARSGSGSLYTVEHFRALSARFTDNAIFCQWLPLHQLDLGTLRSIVRSFLAVYPRAAAILASNSLETPVIGLITRAGAGDFHRSDVAARLGQPGITPALAGLALEDEAAVLGSFIAGPKALARFAGAAALNTDDRPLVAYLAPRATYAPDSRPRERLFSLLAELAHEERELLVPVADPAWQQRLGAYFRARDRYLESGRDVRPAARVEDMLAQVEAPLLEVLRISPDFRPAYDPLFGMAKALVRSDIARSRTLLAELVSLQPARAEASELLSLLDAPPTASSRPAKSSMTK